MAAAGVTQSDAPSIACCSRNVRRGVHLQLIFPPSLTARQRALLHEFAEGAGLQHASTGEGSSRRLQLGPDAAQHKVNKEGTADLPSHGV